MTTKQTLEPIPGLEEAIKSIEECNPRNALKLVTEAARQRLEMGEVVPFEVLTYRIAKETIEQPMDFAEGSIKAIEILRDQGYIVLKRREG